MDRVIYGRSALLINDYPLMVLPQLAVLVGLNEAIILQQVQYWTKKIYNRLSSGKYRHNYQNGWLWVYNSYTEWQKQFPFWSHDTIKRTIRSLEKKNLLITGNFNTLKADRTKWYRINYDALEELTTSKTEVMGANSTVPQGMVHQPIPEINSESTNNNNQNGLAEARRQYSFNKNVLTDRDPFVVENDPLACDYAIVYYRQTYKRVFGKDHPNLSPKQIERIRQELSLIEITEEQWEQMIDKWFSKQRKSDYNLNHFATKGILQNLFYEVTM